MFFIDQEKKLFGTVTKPAGDVLISPLAYFGQTPNCFDSVAECLILTEIRTSLLLLDFQLNPPLKASSATRFRNLACDFFGVKRNVFNNFRG